MFHSVFFFFHDIDYVLLTDYKTQNMLSVVPHDDYGRCGRGEKRSHGVSIFTCYLIV